MTAFSAGVNRRDFILLSAAGSVMLASNAEAAPPSQEDFTSFMVALEAFADQLPALGRAEQDAYVFALASRALRVTEFPIPRMGRFGKSAVEVGPLAMTQPPTDRVHGVALVSYRFGPDAFLQPHNHPNYSVATIGIEGEARVTHYEPESSAPEFSSRTPFTVRRTAERILRRGDVTTLSPSRDNIHTFRAGPAGARFVDLFSIHGEDVGFSFLDIDPQPAVTGGDSFRAVWVGSVPTAG